MVPPRGTLTHRDEPRSTRSAGSHAQVAGQLVPQPGPTVDPPGNWQSSGFSVNMQSCIPGHGSIQSEETQASPFLSRWQEVRGAMTCSLPQRDSHSMPQATGSVTIAHRAGPRMHPCGKIFLPWHTQGQVAATSCVPGARGGCRLCNGPASRSWRRDERLRIRV